MSKMIIESQNLHDIVNSLHDKLETPLKLKDKEISPTIDNLPETADNTFGNNDFSFKVLPKDQYPDWLTYPKVLSIRNPFLFTAGIHVADEYNLKGIKTISNKPVYLFEDEALYLGFEETGKYNVTISNKPMFKEQKLNLNFWGFNTPITPINTRLIPNWNADNRAISFLDKKDISKISLVGEKININGKTEPNEEIFCQLDNNNNLYIFGQGGVTAPVDCAGWFIRETLLPGEISIDFLDTSQTKHMSNMFSDAKLSPKTEFHFDTFQVVDMGGMFSNSTGISNLDLSSFITLKVTNMAGMFQDCTELITLDISNFSTGSAVINNMFAGCTNLQTVYCKDQEEIDRYKTTNPPSNINFVIKGGTN